MKETIWRYLIKINHLELQSLIVACVICYAAMELIENTICRDKIFDPFGRKNRLEISNVIDIYGLNWHLTNL